MERSFASNPLNIAKYFNPSQLQEKAKLPSNVSKHWKNSQNIDIGLNLTHTKSDKSMINYPLTKKHLPKLNHQSPKLIDVESKKQYLGEVSRINTLPKKHLESILPDLEDEEDREWIIIQRKGIEKMAQSHLGDCELVIAEHELIPKEINNTVEKLTVDVSTVWMDKFWKVMLGWGNIESRWPERLVPSLQTGIISLAKKVCLEFYVSQILIKIAKGASISRKLLFKVLKFEGKELVELDIYLEQGYDRLDLNFWKNVFSNCIMLKLITINCSHINEGLTALFTSLAQVYPSIEIKLNIITSDLCEKVLTDISPFCLNPTLTKPKPTKIQREHPKHVHMVPENRFNIQGINSLSEYLDRPVKEELQKTEQFCQKALPISVSFVKQKPGYHTPNYCNSFSIIQTEYLFPHITKLVLKNFCLGPDGANKLSEVLKLGGMLLSLVEIDISNTLITSQGLIGILTALVSSKVPLSSKLQKFECSRVISEKDAKNAEAVKILAQYLAFFPKLDRLGLSNNAIQNVGMRLLTESLIKTNIRDLDLSGTAPSTSLQQLTQWVMTRSGVELDLSNCSLIPRSINTIFNSVDGDRFQALDLSYNTIDSDLADILMEWLPSSNISKLNLSGMRMNESKILKALRLSKTVRSVVFERMGFGDVFGQNLGIGWSRGDLWHVKRWQLAFNKLTSKGLRACKEGGSIGCKKYRTTTVTLECENNYIDSECIKDYQREASHYGWEGVFVHFGSNQRSVNHG
ncbi:hypothetical protein HK103_000028 [Boothiomyces macroporosus]|uniref:RNI-like protein n=1 Tax=Boothiomyces macroporosus TaxID=261099 RepID=A0AAD5UN30_9FUNG|nr:hypothetical protein HK103_000028 [Boothiomyces macroporosus]